MIYVREFINTIKKSMILYLNDRIVYEQEIITRLENHQKKTGLFISKQFDFDKYGENYIVLDIHLLDDVVYATLKEEKFRKKNICDLKYSNFLEYEINSLKLFENTLQECLSDIKEVESRTSESDESITLSADSVAYYNGMLGTCFQNLQGIIDSVENDVQIIKELHLNEIL